ncbi:MAG: hypothetical protein O3C10_03695 [Chloroflexi bacterium]|nr:hypothetical protein [Chloroflexota bacterium]
MARGNAVDGDGGGGMKFDEHVRAFLDGSIDPDEARVLATAAVASNIRQLKMSIAECLWLARQVAADGGDGAAPSVKQLQTARTLKTRYDGALAEFRRLRGEGDDDGEGAGLHLIAGGRDAPLPGKGE